VADGFVVDAQQIRRHADAIAAMRARVGAVQAAGGRIAQDHCAYGLLCAWMAGVLETRRQEHNSLLSYVEENLTLASDALSRSASSYAQTDAASADRIRRAGP